MSGSSTQHTSFGEGQHVPFQVWSGSEDRRTNLHQEFLIRTRRRAPGLYTQNDLEASQRKATVTPHQERLLIPRYPGRSLHETLRGCATATCSPTYTTESSNYFNVDGPLVQKRLLDELGRTPEQSGPATTNGFWDEVTLNKVQEHTDENGLAIWQHAQLLSTYDAGYRDRLIRNINGMAVGIPEAIIMVRGCLIKGPNGNPVEVGEEIGLAAETLAKPWTALSYNHEKHGQGPKIKLERYHKLAKNIWKIADVAIWIDYLSSYYNKSEGIAWYDRGLAPYTMGVVIRLNNNPDGNHDSVMTSRLWLSLEAIAGVQGRGLYSYNESLETLRLVDCGMGTVADINLEKLANLILGDRLVARKVSYQEDYAGFANWAIRLLCTNSAIRNTGHAEESETDTAELLGMAMERHIDQRSNTEKSQVERFLDDYARGIEKSQVPWGGFMELVTNTRFSVFPKVDTSSLQYMVFACFRCNSRVGLLCNDEVPLIAAGLTDSSTARDGHALVVTTLLPWHQRRLRGLQRLPGMQLSANSVWICNDMELIDICAYDQNNWGEEKGESGSSGT